jgi:hypothetical protein
MKRIMDLAISIDRGNGLQQSKVELDYLYIHNDSITVYTKQGNTVTISMNLALEKFVEKLEDVVKEKLETP